jgi:hypothetical protein
MHATQAMRLLSADASCTSADDNVPALSSLLEKLAEMPVPVLVDCCASTRYEM